MYLETVFFHQYIRIASNYNCKKNKNKTKQRSDKQLQVSKLGLTSSPGTEEEWWVPRKTQALQIWELAPQLMARSYKNVFNLHTSSFLGYLQYIQASKDSSTLQLDL